MVESKYSVLDDISNNSDDEDDSSSPDENSFERQQQQQSSEDRPLTMKTTFDGIELNDNNTKSEIEDNKNKKRSSRMIGAGVVGGIVGMVLGGPLLGIITGFGVAYYTKKDGTAGDVARAMGDVGILARDKAKEIDKKHHIVEKSTKVTEKIVKKATATAKRTCSNHNNHRRTCKDVLDKTKQIVSCTLTSIIDYNHEHHVIERTSESIHVALIWLLNSMKKTSALLQASEGDDNDIRNNSDNDKNDNINNNNNTKKNHSSNSSNNDSNHQVHTPQLAIIDDEEPGTNVTTNQQKQQHPTPTAPPAHFDNDDAATKNDVSTTPKAFFPPPQKQGETLLRKRNTAPALKAKLY